MSQRSPRGRKIERINQIIEVCRKNQWTPQTENLGGKLDALLVVYMFDSETRREYKANIIGILQLDAEKKKA